MVKNHPDMARKYGHLTVIKEAASRNGRAAWLCRCDCGEEVVVLGKSLHSGNTQSCGCYRLKRQKEANTKHGMAVRRNGQSEHPVWKAWQNMKRRCDDPRNNRYSSYGGRGITYDASWVNFEAFKADMVESWRPGLTLDRIDVDGHYCKQNCKWSTRQEQMRNRQDTRWVEYRGQTRPLCEWAEILKVTHSALHYRLKQGWTIEAAFDTPFRQYPKRN